MSASHVRIGTSGYVYDHWKGVFYPEDLPKSDWFDHYAGYFDTVEINNTFYSLPEPETVDDWRERAPEGFLYALKVSRYLTHMKKLKDPEEPWATFQERARRLRAASGPVLFQLPPNWGCDAGRLAAFLDMLPDDLLCAFEFRDPDWRRDDVFDLLDAAGAGLCVHDMEGCPSPKRSLGRLTYVRFHGSEGAYAGRYGRNRLKPWARWLSELDEQDDRPVFAYFNNDQKGYAVKDAFALRDLLEE